MWWLLVFCFYDINFLKYHCIRVDTLLSSFAKLYSQVNHDMLLLCFIPTLIIAFINIIFMNKWTSSL